MEKLQHHYVDVNGISMHYVRDGQGPLLLFLHGFPEFWYSWRHQIPAFRTHYTVVAPDMRGYNETEKPTWGYDVDVLTADLVELIKVLGFEQAIVVGHDWGGVLSWMLTIFYPHRVSRLITLNCPHPALMERALRTNPQQLRRSWYMLLFQLPWLPEQLIRANDYKLIEEGLRGMAVHKEAFSDEDIQAYKDAISQPGALTAALNWYRRMYDSRRWFAERDLTVHVPTLMIWGEQDQALGVELTQGTEEFAPNLQLRTIPDSSHWVQQERPDLVNTYIWEFLTNESL